MDVGHLGGVAKQLLRDPWQVAGFRDEAAAFLQYGLFGAALSYWLAREGATRVAIVAVAIGVVTAVGLEASQLIVDSRMPAGADLVVRVLGVLAGVAVWRATPPRSAAWVGLVIAGSAVAAAMQMWSPYEFAETRRPFSWLPFLPYYESNWFPILSHSIELMLLYFPIGFAVGLVSSSPWRAATAAIVATVAICIPVEYVQSWIVTRYASVTDLVMSVAGGIAGIWAATRGARAFQALWDGRPRS
jgi:VanZ family protein